MIKSIKIENFKSIQSLEMELGRLNIFIGANGSGKSNILEAIAMGSAAMEDKLDDEFLAHRGVRITENRLMTSGFNIKNERLPINVQWLNDKDISFGFEISAPEKHFNKWVSKGRFIEKKGITGVVKKRMANLMETLNDAEKNNVDLKKLNLGVKALIKEAEGNVEYIIEQPWLAKSLFGINFFKDIGLADIYDFIVFAPENHFLRRFEEEGALKPLGVKGEGLFKLITIIAEEKPEQFQKIKEHLKLIDWFEDFEIPSDLKFTEKRIKIKDAYLDEDLQYFDQRSANEGFLYLLFYLTLFISDETPHFFSIDNIDNALNPKLGSELIKILAQLSKNHNKQALLTTHNPVILDGLDLTDDDQRLFVVYRNADGHTKVRRIKPPKSPNGTKPVRLSEAFIRGYIGGLPKNF